MQFRLGFGTHRPGLPHSLAATLAIFCLALFVHPATAQHEHGGSLVDRAPDSPRSTAKLEGLHVNPVPTYALMGATVHRSPNREPKVETVIVEHGKIVAVGVEIDIPVGAKKIDITGKHLYAGLIDAYTDTEVDFDDEEGTTYWNVNVRPQLKVAEKFTASGVNQKSMRSAGFTAALIAPAGGIVKGQSSVMLLGDQVNEHSVLISDVAQHIRLTTSRGRSGYPNSPMGAYALARQSMIDANWYQEAWSVANASANSPTPETNRSLAELAGVVDGKQMVMIDSSNELFALRADRFAREFGLRAVVLGSGNEYRRLKEIAKTGRSFVIPVNFPKAPDVSSPDLARDVSLENMMHWDHAPENAARLAEQGVNFVFTSNGLKDKSEYLKNIRIAVERGLDSSTALHAMTLGVAELYGIDNLVGSIEKNKIANMTIADGDLFDKKTKVTGVCIDGKLFLTDHKHLRRVTGNWKINQRIFGDYVLSIKESGKSLSGKFVLADAEGKDPEAKDKENKDDADKKEASESPEIKVNSLRLKGTRLTGTFDSEKLGKPGVSMFTILFADEESGVGQLTLPDGSLSSFTVALNDEWEKVVNGHQHGKTTEAKDEEASESDADKKEKAEDKAEEQADEPVDLSSSFAVNYPLGAYGREQMPEQPEAVLIKNVTVWTLDERGKIESAAILFGGGKVLEIFESNQTLPKTKVVIDGKGGHVTPGIIDCHSHMASDSGINESGQAITAEVRIGDMIDCDDITIYRQLAGGVTMANVLHGSANPIGGQNQVIKLRWGANEEAMKYEAPGGIKFALGENVKQSNWSNPTNRYPQTRMGVEQIMDDAFRAAKDYQNRWADWEKNKLGLPPRRDLELEALAEIVDGERWVHCHSYRQDEILALIRTLDSHGITIGSFQHILEGYKVAEEMAEHGAMASAFSDWWAYKYEVKDAIPFGGALMHQAGVVVSFNSDDRELARHLNQEAAKAVRYGGVSEVEALKFVTLNPARQLRIDDRVGSLQKGKEADLVLWSGHPLSNMSVVKQTWIDGRKYFDQKEDLQQQAKQHRMRVSLIQKILASGQKMVKPNKNTVDPAKLWPRYDEFCGHHGHDDNRGGHRHE